jgi:hypothetical protein
VSLRLQQFHSSYQFYLGCIPLCVKNRQDSKIHYDVISLAPVNLLPSLGRGATLEFSAALCGPKDLCAVVTSWTSDSRRSYAHSLPTQPGLAMGSQQTIDFDTDFNFYLRRLPGPGKYGFFDRHIC